MPSHNHRVVNLVGCPPFSLSSRKGRARLNPWRTRNQGLKKPGKISDSHDSCLCLTPDDRVIGLCHEAVGFVSFTLPCQFEGNLGEPSCLFETCRGCRPRCCRLSVLSPCKQYLNWSQTLMFILPYYADEIFKETLNVRLIMYYVYQRLIRTK